MSVFILADGGGVECFVCLFFHESVRHSRGRENAPEKYDLLMFLLFASHFSGFRGGGHIVRQVTVIWSHLPVNKKMTVDKKSDLCQHQGAPMSGMPNLVTHAPLLYGKIHITISTAALCAYWQCSRLKCHL